MAMNDAEVERQIDQMVRFIKQEAQEKANEIAVSAEEVPHARSAAMHCASVPDGVKHPPPLPSSLVLLPRSC